MLEKKTDIFPLEGKILSFRHFELEIFEWKPSGDVVNDAGRLVVFRNGHILENVCLTIECGEEGERCQQERKVSWKPRGKERSGSTGSVPGRGGQAGTLREKFQCDGSDVGRKSVGHLV